MKSVLFLLVAAGATKLTLEQVCAKVKPETHDTKVFVSPFNHDNCGNGIAQCEGNKCLLDVGSTCNTVFANFVPSSNLENNRRAITELTNVPSVQTKRAYNGITLQLNAFYDVKILDTLKGDKTKYTVTVSMEGFNNLSRSPSPKPRKVSKAS